MTVLALLALVQSSEAQRQSPKYFKSKTVYQAQQGKLMGARVRSDMLRTRWQPPVRKATIKPIRPTKPTKPVVARPTTIKDATTRAYISRSLHQQAGMNYFLKGKNVRVTKVKLDGNRAMYNNGNRYVSWTAKVNLQGGSSYNARGFIRQDMAGKPAGLDRVKIFSSTPSPGLILR